MIWEIFLWVLGWDGWFGLGGWFEGDRRRKVLRENRWGGGGKILSERERGKVDEGEEGDIGLEGRREWGSGGEGGGWWRLMK